MHIQPIQSILRLVGWLSFPIHIHDVDCVGGSTSCFHVPPWSFRRRRGRLYPMTSPAGTGRDQSPIGIGWRRPNALLPLCGFPPPPLYNDDWSNTVTLINIASKSPELGSFAFAFAFFHVCGCVSAAHAVPTTRRLWSSTGSVLENGDVGYGDEFNELWQQVWNDEQSLCSSPGFIQ